MCIKIMVPARMVLGPVSYTHLDVYKRQELMMLAHNVDHCHVLADVHTDTELGKFCADNDFLPELTALPDSVYALLDYAKIGKQMRESEAGTFTPVSYTHLG